MTKLYSSHYILRFSLLILVTISLSILILLTPPIAFAGGTVTNCADDTDLHDKLTGGGIVTFACGTNPVTIPLTIVDSSSGSHLTITQTTTIYGDGLVTLQGNGSDRVFYVDGSELSLDGLTITHGRAFTISVIPEIHSAGGGIFVVNSGAVTITNSTFSDNQAEFGGAIRFYNGGRLLVKNSSLFNNQATYAGGAILVENQASSPMTATILNSALISNTVTDINSFGLGNGGAIGSLRATLIIGNSTLSNNSAPEGGAININKSNNVTLITNTTIVSNSASTSGGGIMAGFGTGTGSIQNTIIANNTGANCSAAVVQWYDSNPALSGNNIDSGSSCGFSASSDLSNTDPLLGPLANNGGTTLSHAPLSGSPAINAADNAACAADPINNIDQIGVSRPLSTACDIGAVEATPRFNLVKSSINEGDNPIQPGELITYTIFATNTGNLTATGGVIFDPVPAHTTFVPGSISLDPPNAGVTGSTPPTLADNLTLAVGESVTLTYAVKVDSPLPNQTQIVNTASITSNEVSTPQTSTVTDTVSSAPVLSVQKTSADSNGGTLMPGDVLSYTIVISNSGNANATGGLISDPVPTHTTFVPGSIRINPSGAGLPGSIPPNLVSNLIITASQSITLTYAVTIDTPQPNPIVITNTATISSPDILTAVTGVVTNTVASTPAPSYTVFIPLIIK